MTVYTDPHKGFLLGFILGKNPDSRLLGGCQNTPPFFNGQDIRWQYLRNNSSANRQFQRMGMVDLQGAAEHILKPLGYEVLELSVSGQGQKRKVLLRIDRLDEEVVSMDDVTLATQVFGLELDRLDPFDSPYNLEVESPGSERPLLTARHFERFHDLLAKVKTPAENFKGIIRKVEGDHITFEVDKQFKTYAIANINAKLAEWPKEPR